MRGHVLLHYHRIHHDYDDFSLLVRAEHCAEPPYASSSVVVLAQPRPNTLTSFGALFRFDPAALFPTPAPAGTALLVLPVRHPNHPQSRQVDAPCRRVLITKQAHVRHVFMVQGVSDVYSSPLDFCLPTPFQHAPRFLSFVLDPATMTSSSCPLRSIRPVLHLYVTFGPGSKGSRQPLCPPFFQTTLFPATPLASPPYSAGDPVLFLLDLFGLYTLPASIIPVLVFRPKQFQPPPPSPLPVASSSGLTLPSDTHTFDIRVDSSCSLDLVAVSCSAVPFASSLKAPDMCKLIRNQAVVNPALSQCTFIEDPESWVQHFARPSPSSSSHASPPPALFPNLFDDNTLTVYLSRLQPTPKTEKDDKTNTEATETPGAVKSIGTGTMTVSSEPMVCAKNNVGTTSVARMLRSQYRSSTVFQVDLPSLLDRASPYSLTLSSCDGSSSSTEGISSAAHAAEWNSSKGSHVILAPTFPSLLTPTEVDLRLYYHRYGQFADWQSWRLRLSASQHTVTLRPHRPHRPGVVFFDIMSSVFPYEATVHAELFRLSRDAEDISATITVSGAEKETDERDEVTPGKENTTVVTVDKATTIDRRDVSRQWKSGQLIYEMHFVQGQSNIYQSPPARAVMERTRFTRLRYRRFLPGDYDSWDIWSWDDADVESNRVPLKPCNHDDDWGSMNNQNQNSHGSKKKVDNQQFAKPKDSNLAWVDFIVDRAQYGAGGNVSLLPRRGGDEWLERDYPIRVLKEQSMFSTVSGEAAIMANANEVAQIQLQTTQLTKNLSNAKGATNVQLFTITQGTNIVTPDLAKEVYSALQVYVESNSTSSVILQTPVPIAWISPPRPNRPDAVQYTTFRLHERAISKSNDKKGERTRLLRFRKVSKVSPTVMRVRFDHTETEFGEDFPVEMVAVTVPGFESKMLQWQTHADWDAYLYNGQLGWEYEPRQCSFRCFAPTADKVSVVLYNRPAGKSGRRVLPMRRIPHGCWKCIVNGNLRGRYYKLLAEGENKRLFPGVEVIDPYSRCNTAHNGRGFIYGVENTPVAPRPDCEPNETVVYELHIRDITIDENSGVHKRGKFAGLCERGTRLKLSRAELGKRKEPRSTILCHGLSSDNVEGGFHGEGHVDRFQPLNKLSTALDHIVEMGVTAVQVMPVQDFDNDESDDGAYRWGYMPVHFNSPDGWYASRTDDASRIKEMKQMVDALHKAGLRVIMDVVYNHTAEDSNELNLDARFSFNGLAPRYYYRTCGNTPVAYTGDSTCGLRPPNEPRCGACYSNGSGCGNEFRSEAPMARKFIIDSLKFWVREYGIDGFRFDLMGLMDVDTLTLAARELHAIDASIILYGEPWAGGLSPLQVTEKGMQRSRGFGMFNDAFRNAVRGSPFESEETFVMDGGRTATVKAGIVGSVDTFCDWPMESINYVECHDNYTLWDHLRFYVRSRADDIVFSDDDLRRMHRLAAAVIFTAQGIPFIQGGQEMCRTKHDVENSYESPDSINRIDWRRKQHEWSTVQYYRGLVVLRRSNPHLFCKVSADDIRKSVIFYEDLGLPVPDRCIAYRIIGNQETLLNRLGQCHPHINAESLHEVAAQWTQVVVLLNPTPQQVEFHLPEADKDVIWLQIVDAKCAGVSDLKGPAIGSVFVEGRSAAVLRRGSEKDMANAQLMLRLDAISDSYCSFHGDDVLGRYAVGLDSAPSAEEANEQRRLRQERRQFEQKQASLKDKKSSKKS